MNLVGKLEKASPLFIFHFKYKWTYIDKYYLIKNLVLIPFLFFHFLCYEFLQSKHQKFSIPLFFIPVVFTLSSFLRFLRSYIFFVFLRFSFLHSKRGLSAQEWD
jgi:hypothetical protein